MSILFTASTAAIGAVIGFLACNLYNKAKSGKDELDEYYRKSSKASSDRSDEYSKAGFGGKSETSPCRAVVIKLPKRNNEWICKGEPAIIIEECKCEINITSPRDGMVHYFVKRNQVVDKGEPLFEIIPKEV